MFKRSVVLGLSLAILALAVNAGAVPLVQFTDGPGGSHPIVGVNDGLPTSGGEFGVDLGANGSIDFWTFCLERDEELKLNTPYDYTIAAAAIEGGVAGGSPDPIGLQTAYLFYLFANHDASLGYVYGDATYANALQDAIWFLEDELPQTAQLSILAQGFVGLGGSNGTYYGVNVINIADAAGAPKQSVLNVPEPGVIILLGSGLLGLGLMRRKVKQA